MRNLALEAATVSLVVPVRNEAENIPPLVADIARMRAGFGLLEAVFVSDGSTDATEAVLAALAAEHDWLRTVAHARSCGQSAAVRTGVRAAHGDIVVTLDGDGQNDPAFVPALVKALRDGGPALGLIQGERKGRRDTRFKKLQSRLANAIRGAILHDHVRDTGCGLKAFRREVYLALPYFDALHRFMPALVRREGLDVATVPVVDRPRGFGVSNYGFWNRALIGGVDLAGVWWLIRRRRRVPELKERTSNAG
ncbi:MAG TPA: glycosyltransferase family 2 protein [Xanthobacteraceae bacterium]|nr:glycosyltransferase family 2 protein [Xanthobacteraceae bacterium]